MAGLNPSVQAVVQAGGAELVNYNFSDISAGTGYVTYYAGTVSGANVLSNNTFYSCDVMSYALITSAAYEMAIEEDFDVKFNTPQNIRGDALITIPLGFSTVGAPAGQNCFAYAVTKIRKWDGTTETEIAASSTPVFNIPVTAVGAYRPYTSRVSIPDIVHFKAGEYLRLTTLVYTKETTTPNNHYVVIGHDPMNRSTASGALFDFGTQTTVLKVQIPFKLNI